MRGEYVKLILHRHERAELPPRARRILHGVTRKQKEKGTTSACAENTTNPIYRGIYIGNYLRVRGEYLNVDADTGAAEELPPRARRILLPPTPAEPENGTTSACAENTKSGFELGLVMGNYLRVRGEYFDELKEAVSGEELPPRARRIPEKQNDLLQNIGTTSACAENT